MNRYKYRLLVDESLSLGVLGAHGRGAAEAAGLTSSDVDIIAASLGNSCHGIKVHRIIIYAMHVFGREGWPMLGVKGRLCCAFLFGSL